MIYINLGIKNLGVVRVFFWGKKKKFVGIK